jgi:hypothetical protein
VVRALSAGLIVAAIAQELAKPKADRTWTGRVLGFVPYDFRRPTLRRVKAAYWNPDDDRLFTERVLGVGWAINFYRLRELLSGAYRSAGEGRSALRRRSTRTASRHAAGSGGDGGRVPAAAGSATVDPD